MWNKRKHFCIQPMNSTRTVFTTARIIPHLISFPQFSYTIHFVYICHIHLFHGNKWTHDWSAPNIRDFNHSVVGQSIAPVSRGQGFKSRGSPDFLFFFFFSGFLRYCIICVLSFEDRSSFNFTIPLPLSSAETFLCCGEDGEKEKESLRGTMGRPFPYFHRPSRAFSIIAIL